MEECMTVQPIPAGYHTITPHLSVENAAEAIEFYKRAFGAVEIDRAPDPSGTKVWHAALRIGDSMLFVNDVFPEMGQPAPSQSSLWLYVPDTDASHERAVGAGAKSLQPPVDTFWGDRMAHVADPFGQNWTFATRVKDMTPDEMQAAAAAAAGG
jgi:PhnB protein